MLEPALDQRRGEIAVRPPYDDFIGGRWVGRPRGHGGNDVASALAPGAILFFRGSPF